MTGQTYSRPITLLRDFALEVTGDRLNTSALLALAANEAPLYDAMELDGFTAHRLTAVLAELYPNGSEEN